MKAKKTEVSKEKKLKNVENLWYEVGLKCVESFNNNSDIVSIRGGVAAHRCMMQSIRDQMRYSIKN